MQKEYFKTTYGFVTQHFVLGENGKYHCEDQSFVAGDDVEYESPLGNFVAVDELFTDLSNEPYQPYDMVQPIKSGDK